MLHAFLSRSKVIPPPHRHSATLDFISEGATQSTGPQNPPNLNPVTMLVLAPQDLTYAQLAKAALTIALTPVVVKIVKTVRRKMRVTKQLAPIPGPKGHWLFGTMLDLVKNLPRIYEYQACMHFIEELMLQYGGRIKLPANILNDGTVMLASAEDVKHILSDNFDNYIKSDEMLHAFETLFGKSFMCLNHANNEDNGEMWKLQRKVAVKVFTTANFKVFTEELFHTYAQEMADLIVALGGKCNMADISTQYTLRTIFDITCGVPVRVVDEKMGLSFMDCMTFAVNNIIERLISRPYYRWFGWCMPSEYRLRRDVDVINRIADSILYPRLAESDDDLAKRNDILSLFIKKTRELDDTEKQGGAASILDIDTLRAVFVTFIIAGWDSTSSLITYLFYVLAQYPDVQQKVYDELSKLNKTALTYDNLKSLKYLDAVAMETLRVYPTLPFNTKIAAKDDHLPDGTFIPAGIHIMYSPWYMNRHSPLWGDDPLVFRAERWLEMKARPSAYEFPVFQAGPRICPGMNMSLLESKMFVAVMLQRFHVKIQDGERVENRPYKFATILTLDNGLPLEMTPRQSAPAF
ncbi:Cytochrome p450 86a2, partial [Globisporangium splendens]